MALFTLGTPATSGSGTLRYEQLTSEETVNTSGALPTSSQASVSQLDDIKALQGSATGAGNAPLIQTSPGSQSSASAGADHSLAAALSGSTNAQMNQQAFQAGGGNGAAIAVPAVESASLPLDNQVPPAEDTSFSPNDRFSADGGQTTNIVINQPTGGGDGNNPQTPPTPPEQPSVDVNVPTPVGDISIGLDGTNVDIGLSPELPLIGELPLDTALSLPSLTPTSLDGLGQTLLDTLSGNAESPLLSLGLGGNGLTSSLAGFGEPGLTTTALPQAIGTVSNFVEQLPVAGPLAANALEPVQDLLSQPLVGLTVGDDAGSAALLDLGLLSNGVGTSDGLGLSLGGEAPDAGLLSVGALDGLTDVLPGSVLEVSTFGDNTDTEGSLLDIGLLDDTDASTDLLDFNLGGDSTPDNAILDLSLDSGDEAGGLLDQIVESVSDATGGAVDATPVTEIADEAVNNVLDTVSSTVNDITGAAGVTSTVDTVADTVGSTTTSTVNTAVQQTITTITSPAIVPPVVTQPVQNLLHGFHL